MSADLCPGESVTINGEIYTMGGTYTDTLTGTGGACDTILTIQINPLSYNTDMVTAGICPGGSVTINGEIYTMAGTYLDTLTGTGGACEDVYKRQA